MTYASSGLSAISYANGFTLWHYRTADRLSEVLDTSYFLDAKKMLRIGDLIIISANAASQAPQSALRFVADTTPSFVVLAKPE